MNRANSPAFPRPVSQDPTGRHDAQAGATLREYLTGQALIGVMAINAGRNPDYEVVARHAVALADLALYALDDMPHEDALKRVAAARADQITRDQERGPLQEGAEDQAPPAPPAERTVEQGRAETLEDERKKAVAALADKFTTQLKDHDGKDEDIQF